MHALSIALHDVAPATWPGCARVLDALQAVAPALPITWLVVPRHHGAASEADAGFLAQLEARLARGDELALHGWTHRDDADSATGEAPLRGPLDALRRRWYTAGEGEFAALPRAAAKRRLEAGVEWFAARSFPPPAGFIAPAWLLGEGAWAALADAPFDYTCTLARLVALQPRRASLASQSLVYSSRAAWRRIASRAWNAAVAHREQGRDAPLLRFELHPWDADHDAVRRSWQGLLARALEADAREPLTLAAAARRWAGVTSTAARARP